MLHLAQRLVLEVGEQVAERFVIASELASHVVEILGHRNGVGDETSGRLPGRPIPLVVSSHD